MHDGKVSTTKMMAWIAWAVSGLLTITCVAVDGVAGGTTTGGMALCTLAIISAAAAATIHTRSFFCAFYAKMDEAFALGVQMGRSDDVPLQRVR